MTLVNIHTMTKQEITQSKIVTKEALQRKVNAWRLTGNKIVFTNGCFDILHPGHVDYLSKAADFGTKLVIGLNTDSSVKRLKGNSRPLNEEQARAQLLASLFFVDAVVLFDEDTPFELISFLKPDILVKGSDYTIDTIVGADIVLVNGGKVETIAFLEGYSTTGLIERIKKL